MKVKGRKVFFCTGLTLGIFLMGSLMALACPTVQQVQEGIKKVFNQSFEVKKVQPSKELPGICEAHVLVQERYNILYVDEKGKYFFAGNLIEIATGKNLTQEASQELNKLTVDDVKKLTSLVAFTVGKKGPEVYFITDPQCPYCKKALPTLKKLTDEGKLKVHVVLFPLSIHPGAKEQSISIICDKKELPGLESGYKSENQCEEGKKKVEGAESFLQTKGIRGTPSYIFPNGKVNVGMIDSEENLLKMAEENQLAKAK
ncbi:MAG: DsbC family protein [Syntrophobacterales bacterium]|nr:DsbC family protein [Syntrophobacterales bacterium]